MKAIIFSIFLFINHFNDPTITEIRKLYPNASNNQNNAKTLVEKSLEINDNDTKTLLAYKGASIIIFAKFHKKMKLKIEGLKEGAKYIENAINTEPNNIEIRMIRLSIQENLPSVVNYKKNIKEDKTFILSHYKEQTGALLTYLKNFIVQSKSFSDQEKKLIQ